MGVPRAEEAGGSSALAELRRRRPGWTGRGFPEEVWREVWRREHDPLRLDRRRPVSATSAEGRLSPSSSRGWRPPPARRLRRWRCWRSGTACRRRRGGKGRAGERRHHNRNSQSRLSRGCSPRRTGTAFAWRAPPSPPAPDACCWPRETIATSTDKKKGSDAGKRSRSTIDPGGERQTSETTTLSISQFFDLYLFFRYFLEERQKNKQVGISNWTEMSFPWRPNRTMYREAEDFSFSFSYSVRF